MFKENQADRLMQEISTLQSLMNSLKNELDGKKQELRTMAQFGEGLKTARVQGEKYVAKIELPSKINWDQKKLKEIYKNRFLVDNHIITRSINYKVDLVKYKKVINTNYSIEIDEHYKNDLIAANLGTLGAPRITIEKVNHE